MPLLSAHDVLPPGTRLGEFEIQRVLGSGGFGVVYLALDHTLERRVAVKEYMPSALAVRGADHALSLRPGADAGAFELGLRSFVNEARLLARFDHPSLVKVHRFWEANGTAYMAMPYYQGRTLQEARREMGEPPDEAWLRRLINPLLGALECLHREQVYHRDIAPDNILLLDDEHGEGDGRPVLLDLGAARRVISDHTQAMTAIVKPSFAPIEQYAETTQLRQGPWTDLYALAAVVHFCITGRPPVPATARTLHDELPSLKDMAPALSSGFNRDYSTVFLAAIDHALAVRPQDRPASVLAWREELAGIVSVPRADAADGGRDDALMPTVLVRPAGEAFATTAPAASVLAAPATQPLPRPGAPSPAAGLAPDASQEGDDAARSASPSPLSSRFARTRRATWVGIAGVFTLAVAGLGWFGSRPAVPSAAPAASAVQLVSAGPSAPSVMPQVAPRGEDAASAVSAGASGATDKARPEDKKREARPGPLNPRAACAGKSFIFLAICMKQHCSRSAYKRHPECVRMRRQEEAQRNMQP